MKWNCHKISIYKYERWPRYEITEHGYLIKYYLQKGEFYSKIRKKVVLLNQGDFNEIIGCYIQNDRYKTEFFKKVEELFDKYHRQNKKERKKLEKELIFSMDKNERREYSYFLEEYADLKDA